MRTMDFTTENLDLFEIGQEYEVTEYPLPSSYYYIMEHALGISANFVNAQRLKTRKGVVRDKKATAKFNFVVLEFDE